MSGPNTNYDPVQVSALDADQVEARVAEALEAIARASTTAELKQVRITHTGDRSALALANREIGALPPAARKDAGKRIGQARGRVNQALKARQQELAEAELEARLAAEPPTLRYRLLLRLKVLRTRSRLLLTTSATCSLLWVGKLLRVPKLNPSGSTSTL